MKNFTNLYSLSKTLRFELIPQGKTLHHIEKKGLLAQDNERAENYKEVKKIIDRYHKYFMEMALRDFKLKFESEEKRDSLSEYFFYYHLKRDDDAKRKAFEDIQKNLRKQIADQFKKHTLYKNLFAKEIIKEELPRFATSDEEKKLIDEFNGFTTYFTGFHENRKNIYSADEKSTAVSYRLIHENLPKFIDNMSIFEKVAATEVAQKMDKIYDAFAEYLNVSHLQDLFKLDNFTEAITQTQIDAYNLVLGGKSLEDGTKLQGLNEHINLYNQTLTDKKSRLPKLKPLFKQILSDRNAISWLPEAFENDQAVLESVESFYQNLIHDVLLKEKGGECSLLELLQNLKEYDLSKIYLRNDRGLTDLSQKMFGRYDLFQEAVEAKYTIDRPLKKGEKGEKFEERKEKFFKAQDSFSIFYLNESVELLNLENGQSIESYFAQLGKSENSENLFSKIKTHYKEVETLLKTSTDEKVGLAQEKENVERLKLLLDSMKALQNFVKPLLGSGNEPEKEERFYADFTKLWDGEELPDKTRITGLKDVKKFYDKVRNYMTRKPYSEEKIKLNFENSTLLDGWDVNKEEANASVILRREGLYYLAIMDKKHNRIFRQSNDLDKAIDDDNCFEKVEYKLLPGANKMLPKVFFSHSRIAEFAPSKEIVENYQRETHKKGDCFNLEHCHQLIDFFKHSIEKHEDWKRFEFQFSDTQTYSDLSGFYREVEQQGYKISFRNIPKTEIDRLVDEGKLYLFQIYNKDFSSHSKGTPNMHTLYWKMLFDPCNLSNVVYKLNGQAELFFRKSSIKQQNRVVHKASEAIANKNRLNAKKQSRFEYDIIKDRRYTMDKFQFHVPITMNFKSTGTENIASNVNQYIKENADDIYIIGISRGERYLLYLSLINLKGEIVEQYSLNEIVNTYNGNQYKTDYHKLLDRREKEREAERESWKTIETIKELKEGYISQVVHKIAELMVRYNAIVVLEDLNFGFMRGRQMVEKLVYQKFQKMLIDKLNYLVDKKKAANELGGVLNALQLTNKFESFKAMGKQSGFLFYVPAWNTSKMDPVTGFVNLFDTRYESVEKAQKFFGKFNSIGYNSDKNRVEFEVKRYSDFSSKADGTRQQWTICTHGSRIETFRNSEKNSQWDNREIVLTDEFKRLFEENKIDICSDLKESIGKQTEKKFFERLLSLFRLTLQMRNSFTGTEIDYLISPVANSDGLFFDSRACNDSLPANADANGAYNIARKGLWVVRQIKQADDLKKIKLVISNKEWLQFTQQKESRE